MDICIKKLQSLSLNSNQFFNLFEMFLNSMKYRSHFYWRKKLHSFPINSCNTFSAAFPQTKSFATCFDSLFTAFEMWLNSATERNSFKKSVLSWERGNEYFYMHHLQLFLQISLFIRALIFIARKCSCAENCMVCELKW